MGRTRRPGYKCCHISLFSRFLLVLALVKPAHWRIPHGRNQGRPLDNDKQETFVPGWTTHRKTNPANDCMSQLGSEFSPHWVSAKTWTPWPSPWRGRCRPTMWAVLGSQTRRNSGTRQSVGCAKSLNFAHVVMRRYVSNTISCFYLLFISFKINYYFFRDNSWNVVFPKDW